MKSNLTLSGTVKLKRIKLEQPSTAKELSCREIIHYSFPRLDLSREVNLFRFRNLPNILSSLPKLLVARLFKIPHFYGQVYLKKKTSYSVIDYGLVSLRVVTNAGVAFIVDAFQNLVELEILKYHGIGTGTNAESVSDTALQTELTTEYNPNNTRATGTTTETSANIYRTVGTNTVDASVAITEHGILSQAAVGGGTLLDRSVFSAVNLTSGESLQSTYDLTLNAGG